MRDATSQEGPQSALAATVPLIVALTAASPAQAVVTDPQLTVDSGVFIAPNTVEITGTMICTAGNDFVIDYIVGQRGRDRGGPFGHPFIESRVCETSGLMTWTLATHPEDTFGQLHLGLAFVGASITMCDGVTCESFGVERNLVLTPA